ncbi:hypothetical protein NFI96_015519 [Prochilodus magdalenae]|nr:hypothetical protein NFI96_015519 [Prochilodus magdalenae]
MVSSKQSEHNVPCSHFFSTRVNKVWEGIFVWCFHNECGLYANWSFCVVVGLTEEDIKVAAGGLFVIGLVVLCVSMLGCLGVHLENRCCLAFYMGFIFAVVFGQLFVTFLLVAKRSKAECCGKVNSSDWSKNIIIQNFNTSHVYPCSCFNSSGCPSMVSYETYKFGKGTNIYPTGCGVKLTNWLTTNVFLIVGMDLGLLAIQILQFALAVHIFRNIGQKVHSHRPIAVKQNAAPDPDLLDRDQEPDEQIYEPQPTAYYQEYGGQGYQDFQHNPHHHDFQASGHPYDHQHNMYPQDDPTQAYNQPQHHHDFQASGHPYDHQHNMYPQDDPTQAYDPPQYHHDFQASGHPYDHQHNMYPQDDPTQAYDQHHHDFQASGHPYDHQHNMYPQDDPTQAYNQPQHQHHQHSYDPEPSAHSYGHHQDNAYDQGGASQSYGDRYSHHGNDQGYPQASNGNYNQGYVPDFNSANDYDCY